MGAISGGGEDHTVCVDSGQRAVIPLPPVPETTAGDGLSTVTIVGQLTSAPPAVDPAIAALIERIIAAHRQRNYWMELRKRSDLSLGSYLRTTLGWHKDLPKEERDRIKAQAQRLIGLGEKHQRAVAKAALKAVSGGGEDHSENGSDALMSSVPLPPELEPFADIVFGSLTARKGADDGEAVNTARMEELARQLPVWRLLADWRGFGPLSLAIIVAECGHDLGMFPNKGKLHKRLGLAVIDDIRQGGLPASAKAEEWIKHGYSRRRRSRIWTISASMLMSRNERVRSIYLARKAYEVARAEAGGLTVIPAAKLPKKGRERFRTLGHVDARARRYAEKHMIVDVWRAWHRASAQGASQ